MSQTGKATSLEQPLFQETNIVHALILWTLIIGGLAGFHIHYQYKHTVEMARMRAIESFNKDVAYRRWAAMHGGVYVPITEQTPPNPYLADFQARDVTTSAGQKLTLVNPAYMTRQVHELSNELFDVKSHLTSLNPLRPANAPDAWENAALKRFESGEAEVLSVEGSGDSEVLRFMRPLHVAGSCLACHAKQGYKVGDVRGGISVSIPMGPFWALTRDQIITTSSIYLVIWLVVSLGIFRSLNRLKRQLAKRHAAEQALIGSEMHLRTVADLAYDWEYWINKDRKIMYMSPSCERISGYPPEFFVEDSANLARIVVAEDQPEWLEHENNQRESKEIKRTQFRIQQKNGGVRWIDHACQPVLESDGQYNGVRVSNRDITERKLVEQNLRLLNQRTNTLLELPKAAENMTEKDFMQLAQERAEDLTGSKVAFIHFVNDDERSIELVTWSHRTLRDYCTAVHDTHYPADQAGAWADALRQRQPVVVNDYPSYPNKKGMPEGHARLDRFISVPVIENGRVVMMTGVGNKDENYTETDVKTVQLLSNEIWRIVQRRRTELELRKLVHAVEQSPENVVITDLNAHIEYVNEAFEKNTGYRIDEIRGKNPNILKSGKTPDATYREMWIALKNGENWSGEFYNRRKDGSEFVEFARVTPLRQDNGRISHFVAVKEDITEKKRLGQELDNYRHNLEDLVRKRTVQLEEARERAEEASKSKSEFLANMSHEIRTPMNAIIGLGHLIRNDGVSERQAEQLGKLDTAARHLLSIINDIMDLSKIEAGKMELVQTDFYLTEVIEQISSLLSDLAQDKGLQLETEVAIERPLVGDPTRVRQALLNYAFNAIKFTEHGKVSIRVKTLEESATDMLVHFEVQDTGVGIDPVHLAKLFQPFEQADNSSVRRHQGTGLGLTITQHLADMMGGEVGAQSLPGQGSLFWFTARFGFGDESAVNQADEATNTSAELDSQLEGVKVLLVEDNEVNRYVALELLQRAGISVDTAENGVTAVEKALSGSYDMVLMDLQMPEMDGLEATRQIRAHLGNALPILAMTANIFEETRQACVEAGMDGFVSKPVDPNELYASIAKWSSYNHSATGLFKPVEAPKQDDANNSDSAAEPPVADQVIDFKALSDMFGGDDNKAKMTLRKFYKHMLEALAEIADGHKDHDMQKISFHAHKLKSAARMIGATGLSDICLGLEKSGQAEKWPETDALFKQLSPEIRRVKNHLDTVL
jgi:two-component system sensor histidine kinase/response regulator